jgi:gibberellin 20-oxidase
MGEVEKLARQLTELLAEGLGLPPTRLNHYFEESAMVSMRLNMYPPCPEPELAIGLRAHTDPHLLTILHQDNVVGLQVFINEQWVTVKPRPECFVVNVGDLFQVHTHTHIQQYSSHVQTSQ